jgi:hypothetical protein
MVLGDRDFVFEPRGTDFAVVAKPSPALAG